MTKYEPTHKTEMAAGGVDRRDFLATSASGLGFLLGFWVDGATRVTKAAGLPAAQTAVNAYIRIGSDESITILFGGCEMGQGSMSGLAQIVAEDLMVDWGQIKVETAPASAISYLTGGSSAVRGRYTTLRKAGATAREMLIAAAAKTWNVPATDCFAQQAKVIHRPTNRALTYGALAAVASTMPVPADPPLTAPANFRLIGKTLPRVDIPAKVNGSAVYGIDVRLDNMVYAVVKHCPTMGGTLARVPATPSGAIAVVPLVTPDNRGDVVGGTVNAVAVVSTNTWKAWQQARQLQVAWTIPASAANLTSAPMLSQAQQLMATGTPLVAESNGDVNGAMLGARKVLELTYTFPYLAHATLEPMNCTANVKADSCEVWAPNQAANWVLNTARAVTGLPPEKIKVNTTYLGGGLGRKIEQDYVSQAIQVSKALGRPVKLFWPREEDFQHDQYRPMAVVKIKAGLDGAGNIVAWQARNVSPSILGQRGWLPPGVADSQATEGLTQLPYAMSTSRSEWVRHNAGVPVGFWRSVGHSINAYAVECMIDELAEASGVGDPLRYRQLLAAGHPRAKAVLDRADQLSTWRNALPPGRAWGVAYAESFNTLVCQVVECSAPTAGAVQVHRVLIVVDCGFAVNPGSVEAQMQGGMVHGLSSALWGQIPFTNGVAQVRNFSNYRCVRLREMPAVQVDILNSGTPTGGTGEPATPPIGPAVANAYYRLTKQRIRSLPMFPAASRMGD